MKKWLQMQSVLFMPVSTLLVAFFWQFFLHPRHISRPFLKPGRVAKRGELIGEAVCIAMRYVIAAMVAASCGLSFGQAFGYYTIYDGIAACYIFTNFSLSHTHLPTTGKDEDIHWVEYSAIHTTNIACGNAFVTWWMSYLNYQIEHHMFPSLPQFRHPQVAPRIKALFKAHGLVYDERPYFPALGDTLRNLHEVGLATVG